MDNEKKEVFTHSAPVEEDTEAQRACSSTAASTEDDWQPGFWKRFPFLGFGALVGVFACLAASIIVLVCSDNRPQTGIRGQSGWPKRVAPNVLLSIFNSVANICFGIAISNGIAIRWWRQAMKGGKLRGLNRSWQFSSSIKQAFFAGKYFNIIALTALAAKMTIIDSTLQQKAISTYTVKDLLGPEVNSTQGYINQTFPLTGRGKIEWSMQSWFNRDMEIWETGGGSYPNQFSMSRNKDDTLVNPITYLNMSGAGFAFQCLSPEETAFKTTFPPTLGDSPYKNSTNTSKVTVYDRQTLFDISFTAYYIDSAVNEEAWMNDTSYIQMDVSYSTSTIRNVTGGMQCPGKLVTQKCFMRPAIVSYPVKLTNYDTIDSSKSTHTVNQNSASLGVAPEINLKKFYTFSYNKSQQNFFAVQGYQNTDRKGWDTDYDDQVGGIAKALNTYLGGSAVRAKDFLVNNGSTVEMKGLAQSYLMNLPHDRACNFNFHNPLIGGQDLLSQAGNYTDAQGNQIYPDAHFIDRGLVGKINQIMWGVATDVSSMDPNNNYYAVQDFNGTIWADTIHYSTNYLYMYGAIISTLVCVLCVLPSYWGYWELGRKVSLGPFEIAAAFRAPDLHHQSATHKTVDELLEEIGERRVRFGRIIGGERAGEIAVAEEGKVMPLAEPRRS